MMNSYNPDVLSCLANLSNDEVFTPPEVANAMLDLLPQELFSDPNTTFLDPACKSGVFLREIAKRLLDGQLPGWKQRVETIDTKKSFGEPLTSEEEEFQEKLQSTLDHIFHKQLFGIAITELTSLLSRRSVYCSKYPNSKYSVSRFDDPSGNIRYKRIQHRWQNKKCVFCGASQGEYDRDPSLESHAYEFIHTTRPEEIFKMKFDVIIGNPPYQLGSNDERSNSRDKPIYNRFIEVAKALQPRYLTMIIPSRWMASGLGLSDFREKMLHDRHIRKLVDFPISNDVFNGVEIKGGVCYFLWDREGSGDCIITTMRDGAITDESIRPLGEYDVFVRDSRALKILKKVLCKQEKSIIGMLSVDKEFGWTSNFDDFNIIKQNENQVPLYYNRKGKRLIGYIERSKIHKSKNLVDSWKVMVPQAGSDGGKKIPDPVLGTSFIAPSPSVCTQTYLFFFTDTQISAQNIQTYVNTKFCRFLISLRKITQHATRSTYTWVPQQDFSKPWTDEELYAKYGLTDEEIAFIESMIKPMELGGDGDE